MNAAPKPLFRVTVEPAGWQFESDGSTTLLAAARAAGIRLASSCRNGTCRACMCRAASGRVRYLIEWPGVSPDERAEGYLLPCIAHADSDLVLETAQARRAPAAGSG